MASYCNVLVRVTNRAIVPWTVITVEPLNEFQGFIYSNEVFQLLQLCLNFHRLYLDKTSLLLIH